MFDPHGIVITADQQMYVADTRNHTVRKIDLKTGLISTVAGTGKAGYSGDGGPGNQGRVQRDLCDRCGSQQGETFTLPIWGTGVSERLI